MEIPFTMEKNIQKKIIPNLWFNKDAEEAVHFYTTVFNRGKILSKTHYTEAGRDVHGMEAGTVLTIEFMIEDTTFSALNGGPTFTFTPAISFIVSCPSVEEVNEMWEKLSKGGTTLMPLNSYPFSERYGWIQDKYGLSWQVIYNELKKERGLMPSLLFTGAQCGKAEEAMTYYTSIFDANSSIGDIARYDANHSPDKEGTIMYAEFTLAGQKFAIMDSAQEHGFTFNEAISFIVLCETQEEIDYYWEKLSTNPEAEQCGWLKDRYGVSWQIVPTTLGEILMSTDRQRVDRVMAALLEMKKLDIGKLEEEFIKH